MAILTMARHRFYNNAGAVNAGGKVYTYTAGTSTPVATYTSSSAATPNANPIILDSKGECDLWITGQIKINVLESDNTQVTGWPVDNIGSGVSNNDAQSRWAGTAGGTANALTITPSPSITEYVIGQSFIFKSGASANTTATTIAISGLSTIAVQSNGAACSGGEILANNWYMGVLSTTAIMQISKIGEPTLAELGAAAIAGSVSQAFSVASLELGNASDTTLTRVSAGVVAIEGVNIITTSTVGKRIAQIVTTQDGAVATGTTVLPFDNTIPQITEGDQYLSRSITPTDATSTLEIEVEIYLSHSASVNISAALFQDATANALAAATDLQQTGTGITKLTIQYFMTAGTTSATTFKVRAGGNTAGTTTINGGSGVGQIFGGIMATRITVTEYLP